MMDDFVKKNLRPTTGDKKIPAVGAGTKKAGVMPAPIY